MAVTAGRSERVVMITLVAAFALILVGVVGVIVWSSGREAPPPAAVDYEEFRAAWESAMEKAGVEATFPIAPVRVEDLEVSGFTSVSATFTAQEITALATMYGYSYESPQGSVTLQQPEIGFPADGRASVSARIVYQGSSYSVRGSVDVAIEDGRLVTDPSTAEFVASGFTLDGERRDQALRGVEAYVRELLTAAPRLSVLSAEIIEGEVHVEGAAPQRIRHPSGN